MKINDTFQKALDESHDGYIGSRDALGFVVVLAVAVMGALSYFLLLVLA